MFKFFSKTALAASLLLGVALATPANADGKATCNNACLKRVTAKCYPFIHNQQKKAAIEGRGTYDPNNAGLAMKVQECVSVSKHRFLK